MYKTILLPIDIAHAGEVETIVNMAKAHGGTDVQIILLNVIEEIPNWAAVELPRGIVEKSFESSQESLNTIAKEAGAGTVAEVRVGHPYRTILEVADEKSVDLIIVTSHQPGLQDYFLGSTAAKVVRHAKCSVLVVR